MTLSLRNQSITFTLLIACLGLGLPEHSAATVIEELSFGEIADRAVVIFTGEVTDLRVEQPRPGKLITVATFSVSDVIKGPADLSQVELKFLGGTLGIKTMRVIGSRHPKRGESGIYFVESLSGNLINPLLGWSQGHFLIQNDENDEARVTTVDGRPVLGLSAVSPTQELPLPAPPPGTGGGAGIEVITGGPEAARSGAMKPEAFVSGIRGLIAP